MPLRDAFANPRADAYKSVTKSASELARIAVADLNFQKALIFDCYGDIEKYLLPEEQKWYVEALKELRDLRITSPQTSIEGFILYVKNIFLKHE